MIKQHVKIVLVRTVDGMNANEIAVRPPSTFSEKKEKKFHRQISFNFGKAVISQPRDILRHEIEEESLRIPCRANRSDLSAEKHLHGTSNEIIFNVSQIYYFLLIETWS